MENFEYGAEELEHILHAFPDLSPQQKAALEETAAQIASRGKGILAADESPQTIGKRLVKAGLTNTPEVRGQYREVLLGHPRLGEFLSGCILHEETLGQSDRFNVYFPQVLSDKGILPGVKVDKGLAPLDGSPQETWTKGLGDLHQRCKRYHEAGARFAKWRAVIRIDGAHGLPTDAAIRRNARELACYARIAQAAKLVPIVEPEVLIEGGHSARAFEEVTGRVLSAVYAALAVAGVHLEGTLLKPQMIVPGVDWVGPKPAPRETAEATLRVLRRHVPPAVPGIVFLSGGQSEVEATRNLAEINRVASEESGPSGRSRYPWTLSFSFGRSLQASVLQVWTEKGAKGAEAMEEAMHVGMLLAQANSAAQRGEYEEGGHPSRVEAASLHETHRGWGGAPGPAA